MHAPVVPRRPPSSPVVPRRLPSSPVVSRRLPSSPVVPRRPPSSPVVPRRPPLHKSLCGTNRLNLRRWPLPSHRAEWCVRALPSPPASLCAGTCLLASPARAEAVSVCVCPCVRARACLRACVGARVLARLRACVRARASVLACVRARSLACARACACVGSGEGDVRAAGLDGGQLPTSLYFPLPPSLSPFFVTPSLPLPPTPSLCLYPSICIPPSLILCPFPSPALPSSLPPIPTFLPPLILSSPTSLPPFLPPPPPFLSISLSFHLSPIFFLFPVFPSPVSSVRPSVLSSRPR